MDARKTTIKELEGKKQADFEARKRLLEGLGETLFQRIGSENPFTESVGNTPGGLLTEYRRLHKEIAESAEMIKFLENEILKLKELEKAISEKEAEKSRIDLALAEVHTMLGLALFNDPEYHNDSVIPIQEAETLLGKIDEQETKLNDLEKQEGGILTWLGKNAQMAVSKTILAKHRSSLQRLYRSTGEKFNVNDPEKPLEGEVGELAEKARDLRGQISSLVADLAVLKGERRKIGDSFGSDGSPSRRIQGLEKHITHVKGEFTSVYLRFGSLAAEDGWKEALAAFIKEEDSPALANAEYLKSQVCEYELKIKKIKASIRIDEERNEIEKIKKSIVGQQQKIVLAGEAIANYEKQIAEIESKIEELNVFIQGEHGIEK